MQVKTLNVAIAILILMSTIGNIAEASENAGKLKAFKGWELYSWKDGTKWNFSLLVGTNRRKFCSEVKDEKGIKTLEQLEASLAELSPSEYVTWITIGARSLEDKCDLELPPDSVVKELQAVSLLRGLNLNVPARVTEKAAVGSTTVKSTSTEYKKYVNVRYCFAIEYPAAVLEPQGESDNSDGQSFKSKSGDASLSAWGCHALDAEGNSQTIGQDFKQDLSDRKGQTTYKASGKDWYVVSGKDQKGNLFYEKTLLKDGDFKKFSISYPAAQAELYKPIIERVSRTFHSTTPVQYGK